jgi:hypothetical protein
MALRRLFPIAARIDYIVVDGKEWVPNPEKRYSQSYEFREALILVESSEVDEKTPVIYFHISEL